MIVQPVKKILIQGLLERERAIARRQRLVLEGLQLGRDVALGVLQGLAARNRREAGRSSPDCAFVTSM